MILFLRGLFLFFFLAISGAVIWASLDTPLWSIPSEVTGDAWFRTTLVDIYVSFFTFYVWVAYRETTWWGRLGWLLAIVGLGSIAVSGYCLFRLFQVPTNASIGEVLLRKSDWKGVSHGF